MMGNRHAVRLRMRPRAKREPGIEHLTFDLKTSLKLYLDKADAVGQSAASNLRQKGHLLTQGRPQLNAVTEGRSTTAARVWGQTAIPGAARQQIRFCEQQFQPRASPAPQRGRLTMMLSGVVLIYVSRYTKNYLLFLLLLHADALAVRLLHLLLGASQHRLVRLQNRTISAKIGGCTGANGVLYIPWRTRLRLRQHGGTGGARRMRSPLPWVDPRRWFEYPNMAFRLTFAVTVNSSSRTSLSVIVPRRVVKLPITAPAPRVSRAGGRDGTYSGTRRARRPRRS